DEEPHRERRVQEPHPRNRERDECEDRDDCTDDPGVRELRSRVRPKEGRDEQPNSEYDVDPTRGLWVHELLLAAGREASSVRRLERGRRWKASMIAPGRRQPNRDSVPADELLQTAMRGFTAEAAVRAAVAT